MKTRLMLAGALIAHLLSGCVTDPPRVSGSFADKSFKEEIGKPLPASLSAADCAIIH